MLLLDGEPELSQAIASVRGATEAVVPVSLSSDRDVLERDEVSCGPDETFVLLAPKPKWCASKAWPDEVGEILAGVPGVRVILHSNLEVYGPDHPSKVPARETLERRSSISNARAEFWEEVEAGLQNVVAADRLLTLQTAGLIGSGLNGWLGKLLRRRFAGVVLGFDPAIQLIGEEDLVDAVRQAVEKRLTGTFNLASPDALPLKRILREAGVRSDPVPWPLLLLHREAGRLAF